MLTTPTLRKFNPFNATEDFLFKFNYKGSNQAAKNNLVIEKIDDNTVVYDQVQATFSLQHNLPPDILINGVNYRAKVRVGDISDNWSSFSDYIMFWVFDDPALNVTTIDYENLNRVYNQTINFETTYSHANGEVLQSYRYLLYDNNKDLITTFSPQYADGTLPLTQEIAGLENGKTYYIEIVTESVNSQLGSSGLINFEPFYVVPKLLTRLVPENLSEQGAIKLTTDVFQLILKLYDENNDEINQSDIDFIDNDWIDMNRDDYIKLVAGEGFEIGQSDFVLQIWCKDIPEDKIFLTLYSSVGKIELKMYGNRIHAFKSIYGSKILGHFASNEFITEENDVVTFMIKQHHDLIDIFVQTV